MAFQQVRDVGCPDAHEEASENGGPELIRRDSQNDGDECGARPDSEEQQPVQSKMHRGHAKEDGQCATKALDDGAALERPAQLIKWRKQMASRVRRPEFC